MAECSDGEPTTAEAAGSDAAARAALAGWPRLLEHGAAAAASSGTAPLVLHGCHGAFAALTIAHLARGLPGSRRPLLVLSADENRAQELARDLAFFLAAPATSDASFSSPVLHFPAIETSPYAEITPDRRAIQQRLAVLFRLSQGFPGQVVVASAQAYSRLVIARASLAPLCDLLLQGEEIDRQALVRQLLAAGYSRMPVVEDPGTFAVRGLVVDIFPPLYRYPLRLELDGDLCASIRLLDPATQRSLRAIDEAFIHPVRETVLTSGAQPRARILAAADAVVHPSARTRAVCEQLEAGEDFFGIEALTPAFHGRMVTLADYLPPRPLVFLEDPEALAAALAGLEERAALDYHGCCEKHRLAFPPGDHFAPAAGVLRQLAGWQAVEARPLEGPPPTTSPVEEVPATGLPLEGPPTTSLPVDAALPTGLRFRVESNADLAAELRRARAERGEQLLGPLAERLRADREQGRRCLLVVHNLSQGERLQSLLRGYHVEPQLRREPLAEGALELLGLDASTRHGSGLGEGATIVLGLLSQGFRLPDHGIDLIAEPEIFGARALRRSPRPRGPGLGDFRQLAAGDYVVHAEHGIGVYRGLRKLPLAGSGAPLDFLQLEYEGGTLYLPVYRLDLVQRYVGADQARPRLDRLGGQTWERTRRKVSEEVRKLAEELLQLYARRQALPGHAFPEPDAMFQEFEATFPFEETPDQQRAIAEVLADMAAPRPMDRLVCGDVGYGKTEVALRAALLAVEGGRQVAVLAPTTVLVEQHALTFGERLRDYPVKLAALSRFKSRREQQEIVKQLAAGQADVVIGTHRLLSKDVHFRKLGLVIIDEEQRFGVAHKERLKQLRAEVDVLTLTATPIPRTLHLSMAGLREISIISTPPADRRAIRTFVARFDEQLVREAIRREHARGGQVFFVHNRVEDIESFAERVRSLAAGLRVTVAHGQLEERRLEQVMVDFVDGRIDVLVCTTIIESGLDIPRANTMLVDRADTFGLAQLYQLRGRIGRSRERAFCYLLVPPAASMSSQAKQRLAVLQRFTELGAGFSIASHDLEIRGAGDLLGARQSGQIAAVGFDMYTRILEEAVAELRGQVVEQQADPEISTFLPGYIPDDYISDVGQRLDLYKRLAQAVGEDEIRELLGEARDRFGPLPEQVELLGRLMSLKADGRRLGATAIDLSEGRLQLTLSERTRLRPERVLALVNRARSPYRLTPDMRLLRSFSLAERQDPLASATKVLQELLGCAS